MNFKIVPEVDKFVASEMHQAQHQIGADSAPAPTLDIWITIITVFLYPRLY